MNDSHFKPCYRKLLSILFIVVVTMPLQSQSKDETIGWIKDKINTYAGGTYFNDGSANIVETSNVEVKEINCRQLVINADISMSGGDWNNYKTVEGRCEMYIPLKDLTVKRDVLEPEFDPEYMGITFFSNPNAIVGQIKTEYIGGSSRSRRSYSALHMRFKDMPDTLVTKLNKAISHLLAICEDDDMF